MADLTAGTTLRAVAALRTHRTFTADQTAYLMALAYDSGRTCAYREDLAEMHSVWEDHADRRRTYEQRVADRMAEMDRSARARAEREGRPYRIHPGGPVDWETGQPVRILAVAA